MVDGVEIRSVGSGEERASVRDLLRSEFEVAPGVGQAFTDLYDQLLDQDPTATPDCSRIACLRDVVIGHAFLAPRSIRICGGDCPAGLVGLVVVHPDHRRQGVATALIEDLHTLAVERGLGILVLAGDPAFYRRFGYHQAFVTTTCDLEVDREGSRSTCRSAGLDDVDRLTLLSSKAVPNGSVSPTPQRWSWLLRTGHPGALLSTNPIILGEEISECACLIEDAGDAYARVAFGDDTATVFEAGAEDGAGEGIVRSVMALCRDRGIETLRLRLPPSNPLMRSVERDVTTVDHAEFQFRIVNLDILLKAAEPGLERRVRNVCPEWRGAVLIKTESDFVLIARQEGELEMKRVTGNRVEAPTGSLEMPTWGLGRMLLGQDDLVRASAGGNGDLDPVLEALCGPERPTFCLSDAI